MKVYLTRDSVAAGDDAEAPHDVVFSVQAEFALEKVLSSIVGLSYLPTVNGGATWTLSSLIPLAVFSQEWLQPKNLSSYPVNLNDLDFNDSTLKMHFSYHGQISPDIVLKVLERLRLKAVT